MGKSEGSLITRRITIQYLIPVQVKSSQVEEYQSLWGPGTWNLGGTRSIAVTVTPFSLLESGSPATLLSLCLSFFVSLFLNRTSL